MKVVIAPDSFKGSATAMEVAKAIEKGINTYNVHIDTVLVPVADGGEGTMDSLVDATGGKKVKWEVTGPLGERVLAEYGQLGNSNTCVIEMASASGLDLLSDEEKDPLKTTTFGTGELIKKALDDGYRTFILAIGGSATNDGGAGMLQALGMRLLTNDGKEIGFGGDELDTIVSVDDTQFDKRIKESTFLIATDVQNPFIGPNGASYIFGPQKGATEEMVASLDKKLAKWATRIEEKTGIRVHDMPGAGAAGGLGGAFQAFFPATMKRGVDVVIEYTKLKEEVQDADLVITGEGQVDAQTASGKTPMGVAQVANEFDVPTVIIAGSVGKGIDVLYQYGVKSIHSIVHAPISLRDAMQEAPRLLQHTAEQVMRAICIFK